MEGASDEGGGGDVAEAHPLANYFVLRDHVWMHVIKDLSIVRVGRRYWLKEEIKKVVNPFLKFNIRGKLLYHVTNLLSPIANVIPIPPVSAFRKAQAPSHSSGSLCWTISASSSSYGNTPVRNRAMNIKFCQTIPRFVGVRHGEPLRLSWPTCTGHHSNKWSRNKIRDGNNRIRPGVWIGDGGFRD